MAAIVASKVKRGRNEATPNETQLIQRRTALEKEAANRRTITAQYYRQVE